MPKVPPNWAVARWDDAGNYLFWSPGPDFPFQGPSVKNVKEIVTRRELSRIMEFVRHILHHRTRLVIPVSIKHPTSGVGARRILHGRPSAANSILVLSQPVADKN